MICHSFITHQHLYISELMNIGHKFKRKYVTNLWRPIFETFRPCGKMGFIRRILPNKYCWSIAPFGALALLPSYRFIESIFYRYPSSEIGTYRTYLFYTNKSIILPNKKYPPPLTLLPNLTWIKYLRHFPSAWQWKAFVNKNRLSIRAFGQCSSQSHWSLCSKDPNSQTSSG